MLSTLTLYEKDEGCFKAFSIIATSSTSGMEDPFIVNLLVLRLCILKVYLSFGQPMLDAFGLILVKFFMRFH